MQGLADRHMAVTGHHSEQDGLSTSQEMFPKDLGHASIEQNGLPFTEGIDDQFRGIHRGVASINKGEIGQKKYIGELHNGLTMMVTMMNIFPTTEMM